MAVKTVIHYWMIALLRISEKLVRIFTPNSDTDFQKDT